MSYRVPQGVLFSQSGNKMSPKRQVWKEQVLESLEIYYVMQLPGNQTTKAL